MIQLRPYQSALVDEVQSRWNGGEKNVLAVLPTGGGKSVCISEIALNGYRQGMMQVIFAHRSELVGQMSGHIAARGIPHRIIGPRNVMSQIAAQHRRDHGRSFINPDANTAVASVQTIAARSKQLGKWAAQIDRWTCDECFPPGTLISTPDGTKSIEQIEIGDLVTAFNESTGLFETEKVNRLFKNPKPDYMVSIYIDAHHVIDATKKHPFWTKRGWVDAVDLTVNDEILYDISNSSLPYVRRKSDSRSVVQTQSVQEKRAGLLWKKMFNRLQAENFIRNDDENKFETRIGKNEKKQSDASPRNTRKNATNFVKNKPFTKSSRRKRKTTNKIRNDIIDNVKTLRFRSSTQCESWCKARRWLANTLQNRLRQPNIKDRYRSGWFFTPINKTSRIRQKKRCLFNWKRVESVQVYKSRNHGKSGESFVYNIEVDRLHTYVANGIVVHNCHHLIGGKNPNIWGRAVKLFPRAHGLGVTATPSRADGQGLGVQYDGVFDAMVTGPSMRELINAGYLSEYQIAIPESDFYIADDAVTKTGDYSRTKMREASKRSHIVGDVVNEYLRLAPGKRGICFATDVETSKEIAGNFKAAGVRAESVSAKTDGALRAEYIRRFRAGEITMLVNVDLFGEGFDVPAVEVVIMARPTASLGVYLQQFGRALRIMDGKSHGLVIDHVSNWKRHGLPDKAHQWTLSRREKRAKSVPDPEDIPLTACKGCSQPYERFHNACPYCGHVPVPGTVGRGGLEKVDGDLLLLTAEALAAMRRETILETPSSIGERVGAVAGEFAGKRAINKQIETVQAQQLLTAAIDQWAGIQRHNGRGDSEIYRRFYIATGVDTLTAQTLPRKSMERLTETVQSWYM